MTAITRIRTCEIPSRTDCAICLESFSDDNDPAVVHEGSRGLQHPFHEKCLRNAQRLDSKARCPTCRDTVQRIEKFVRNGIPEELSDEEEMGIRGFGGPGPRPSEIGLSVSVTGSLVFVGGLFAKGGSLIGRSLVGDSDPGRDFGVILGALVGVYISVECMRRFDFTYKCAQTLDAVSAAVGRVWSHCRYRSIDAANHFIV